MMIAWEITRARLQLLQTACISMPTSRPLCFQEPEMRSGCYEQRSSHWREDAGETPAVQDGTSHRCSKSSPAKRPANIAGLSHSYLKMGPHGTMPTTLPEVLV